MYMKFYQEQYKNIAKDEHRETVISRRCFLCGIAECDLSEGQQLRECPPCKKIDRKMAYCSKSHNARHSDCEAERDARRECQTPDWKRGTPVPHKTLCGKDWSFDFMLQHAASKRPVETSAPWLPAAQLGFKRSPALLYQLSMLKDTPDDDYVVRT